MFQWILAAVLVAFFLYFFAVGFYCTFFVWRGTWPDFVGLLRIRLRRLLARLSRFMS